MLQRLILVFIFLSVSILGFSQEKPTSTATPKQRAKQEKKQQKAAVKEQEKLKKAYRKRQTKSTRKSMKKNAKRSKLNRKGKGEKTRFWQRWF